MLVVQPWADVESKKQSKSGRIGSDRVRSGKVKYRTTIQLVKKPDIASQLNSNC